MEMTHVELAGGRACFGAMGDTIDHKSAYSANPFAAVMVKCDWVLAFGNEVLVDNIEHFEKRHLGGNIFCLKGFHSSRILGIFLPPDMEGEIHYL